MKTLRTKLLLASLLLVLASVACNFGAGLGPCLFGDPSCWADEQPQNTAPGFNPAYVDEDGDGFVPAAGDPLYDEHYAKEVNNPNADAKETLAEQEKKLAEARLIEEQRKALAQQTDKAARDTAFNNFLRTIVIIIFAIIGGVIVIGLLVSALKG